ncbi:MAG: hypothetical protein GY851_13140, partial [bacterium]|nr:hypothetical protein [bacterium]
MKARQVVEKAMCGAHGAQASLRESEYTNVSFENGRLKSVESSQNTNLAARVIRDDRVGTSYTTDVTDVEGVTTRALDAAEFGSIAHYEFAGPAEYPAVKVHDKRVVPVTKEEMVAIGEEMVAMLRDYDADIQVSAGVWRGIGKSEIATSAGAEGATESTSFGAHLTGLRVRGTDMLWAGDSFGWHSREVDHVAVARKAVERFQLAEKTASVKSGDLPVLFTPEGMRVLLLALVLGVNGKNVFLGSSPLKERLGETIADSR